ncbi:TPA: hypothetical protein U2B50_000734 [Streptococcus suis]|nr:hypothetical protein [Streptococcus suis]
MTKFGIQVVKMPEPTNGLQVLCLDRNDQYCIRSVSEDEVPLLLKAGMAAICTEDNVHDAFKFINVEGI